MSSRGEGYLQTDREGEAPPTSGFAIHLLFALVLSLLTALQFSSAFADQRDEPPSTVIALGSAGTGLFALPLEELLGIDVSTTDHFISSRDGIFSLTSHELLRLYAEGEDSVEINDATGDTQTLPAKRQIPVLIRGEYAGSFNDLRSAIRFVQHITRNNRRVELYVGSRARWFEGGRHQIILDIQEGVDSLTSEPSLDASTGTPTRMQSGTEVQP